VFEVGTSLTKPEINTSRIICGELLSILLMFADCSLHLNELNTKLQNDGKTVLYLAT
jgi:hypothetical protein